MRTAILHLLPFSSAELQSAGAYADDPDTVLYRGSYPPIFDRPVHTEDFYPSYVETYLERGPGITAVEIKSGATLHPSFFDGLSWFAKQTGLPPSRCALVYGGDQRQSRAAGEVFPWFDAVI